MITIQSVMLVSLGFLLATLMALMLAPAYRARAVRLTTDRLKKIMPLTAEEIRAEKDRVRTQYALRVHELEKQLERSKLTGARQQVELNRRDARISGLEDEIASLTSDLEQHLNARRVLEQTVVDRVPAIEQRLAEAKSQLFQRDRELAAVSGDTGKTVRALDEAMQINAHQRTEIERLTTLVTGRGGRPSLQARPDTAELSPGDPTGEQNDAAKSVNSNLAEQDRSKLPVAAGTADAGATAATIDRLTETVSGQAAKIRQLEAALAVFEQGDAGRALSLKDSKLAMKSRIASLQAEVETQTGAIQKLRTDLASANERLALQSAQFVDEMRKLGAAGGSSRRQGPAVPRRSLADRLGEGQPAAGPVSQTVNGSASGPLISVTPPSGEDRVSTAVAVPPVNEPVDKAAKIARPTAAPAIERVDGAAKKDGSGALSGAPRRLPSRRSHGSWTALPV